MIKNKVELLSHGHREAREKALDIVMHALNACDPLKATRRFVTLDGSRLSLGDQAIDLDRFRRIFVIGSGKATYLQAVALEEILGDRITGGLVVVKDGQKGPLKHIRIKEAAHPVPDQRSFDACREILEIADNAGSDDLVICAMSGGISSLCIQPVPGISLADKIEVNRLMVHSGAEVTEIMSVRRHLSRVKGGRLAERIQPAVTVALTVSDAIGDPIEWNTDWTSPDSSTFEDAVRILKRYAVWDLCPLAVKAYFTAIDPAKETPKSLADCEIYTKMTVRIKDLWTAAIQRASKIGLTPHLLTTTLCGESREVGRVLASIAAESAATGNPFQPPCALIASGETAVRVMADKKGLGGANQELAAGAALNLVREHCIAVCALDTDGTDGPTHLAGALTDYSTVSRAAQKGYDVYRVLLEHDITPLLMDLDDAVDTGSTGTNVNDLVVMVVLPTP